MKFQAYFSADLVPESALEDKSKKELKRLFRIVSRHREDMIKYLLSYCRESNRIIQHYGLYTHDGAERDFPGHVWSVYLNSSNVESFKLVGRLFESYCDEICVRFDLKIKEIKQLHPWLEIKE
jgi:hypothetical protein